MGCLDDMANAPGDARAMVRQVAAHTLVRYLDGDLSLLGEIAANRVAQEDNDGRMRICGSGTTETKAVRRKHEELELLELECRMSELKRSRVQAAVEMARLAINTLTELKLGVSDQDQMQAKSLIMTTTFTED
jgi:hypothetical protein